ncbi:hypothetical protein G7046_g7336 [Stylonectria norvegica]|nr:hypothetical protein G7046_g7336 [Stylonectria norvegica]
MTGEALLASWLRELEIRGFVPSDETSAEEQDAGLRSGMGREQEVWFQGRRVEDVELRLWPLLDDYMVATAVKRGEGGESVEIGEFVKLEVDQVLAFAEGAI